MTGRGTALLTILALAGCTDKEPELMLAPPPVAAGLPSFSGAPTMFGTAEDPTAYGPATARIEGNTFYILTDAPDRANSVFSRRISYNPVSKTLTSAHRDLDLVYDETRGAFVGTIKNPTTRRNLRVETTVPASALP